MSGPHGEPCSFCPNQEACAENNACDKWEGQMQAEHEMNELIDALIDAAVEFGARSTTTDYMVRRARVELLDAVRATLRQR